MSAHAKTREDICVMAASLFDRGLTSGSSGNISVKLDNGNLLITPTGKCFGRLDPAELALVGLDGQHIGGLAPTKEISLHTAFYETRASTGAVVHLHSTHSVAVSILPDTDPDNVLLPLTPYAIMKLGKVTLLPVFMPGDPAMGDAVRGLAGRRSAVLLANHGPVVAGKDLEAAVFATEELEETAKLMLLTQGMQPKILSPNFVKKIVSKFNVDWDT
jgi:ribulose-5-phosphate 4-epimerase/fuculose-1-phosphate aldolase